MTDRAAGRDGLCRRDNGVGINAVVPIELGKRSGLSEMLDTKGARPVASDGTEPSSMIVKVARRPTQAPPSIA